MNFKQEEALEILERTPETLGRFLTGLSEGWLNSREGEDTWSPAQVVDHLIECERSNWIPRLKSIVDEAADHHFPPFDREAHLKNPVEPTMPEKIHRFQTLRLQNCKVVSTLVQSDEQLEWTGIHPAFGEVKLRELLSTWVVHDLTHLSQIVRVMAERYRDDVGPWEEYLGVLKN